MRCQVRAFSCSHRLHTRDECLRSRFPEPVRHRRCDAAAAAGPVHTSAWALSRRRSSQHFADPAAGLCDQVQAVEFNETTSFRQQLEVISGTGLFVSVHTSNLANAQFLRPGAAVLEVIQRNWAHHDLDKSFQVRRCSRMLGCRSYAFSSANM